MSYQEGTSMGELMDGFEPTPKDCSCCYDVNGLCDVHKNNAGMTAHDLQMWWEYLEGDVNSVHTAMEAAVYKTVIEDFIEALKAISEWERK